VRAPPLCGSAVPTTPPHNGLCEMTQRGETLRGVQQMSIELIQKLLVSVHVVCFTWSTTLALSTAAQNKPFYAAFNTAAALLIVISLKANRQSWHNYCARLRQIQFELPLWEIFPNGTLIPTPTYRELVIAWMNRGICPDCIRFSLKKLPNGNYCCLNDECRSVFASNLERRYDEAN
jgi:hypothetical protein